MERQVNWRRNLAALWFAQLTAIFGFSFAFPFLPLYLRELGLHSGSQLALWTGLTGGAAGFAQAVASPIWGIVADRYGRKPMLLRAMIGGGITVGLVALARAPVHLLLLRALQGATSGTVPAAQSLVAGGTPRTRVGWALGIMSSAIAVGAALGPLAGGLLAGPLGLRTIFFAGGVLLVVAAIPVFILVEDVGVRRDAGPRPPVKSVLGAAGPGTMGAVTVLIACQALLQISYSGFQPLLVLKLLGITSSGVTRVTGLTFASAGLCSALAAVSFSRLAARFGYVWTAVGGATLLAASEAVAGVAPSVPVIVVAGALSGLFFGVLGPAVASMLGLETPLAVQGTIFGAAASATALGFGIGPLLGGTVAAAIGVPIAILIAAAAAAILGALIAYRGREPAQ